MGYVDKQIAAAQKRIADAVAGKGLRDAIRKLQEKSQIRDTLEEARVRGALVAKRKLAKRTGTGAAALYPPFTEVDDSRTFHGTVQTFRSSDGLFIIQLQNVYELTTKDSQGTEVKFIYDDYQIQ